MQLFIKCTHCHWIDYTEQANKYVRCPKCGSPAQQRPLDTFSKELVKAKIQDTRLKWREIVVTYKDMEERFKAIMGDTLYDVFPIEHVRVRVSYMMMAYIWLLLKTSPQLWANIDLPISGLKELMTLKVTKDADMVRDKDAQLKSLNLRIMDLENNIKHLRKVNNELREKKS